MTDSKTGIGRCELAVWCENGHSPQRADKKEEGFYCPVCKTTYEANVSFEVTERSG